jgi:hypothetical protein
LNFEDVALEVRDFKEGAMQFEGRHDGKSASRRGGMWEIATVSEEAALASEEVKLNAGCEEGSMEIEEGIMEILGSHQVRLP